MKKNGVLCIAIAVALLVGGVATVSASNNNAFIIQGQFGAQDIENENEIEIGGNMNNAAGNFVGQVVVSYNRQTMIGRQCAGINQIGDWSPSLSNWNC